MRRLNGWQRLWLIATVPWVVGIALFAALDFPTDKKNFEFWAWSMEHTVGFHRFTTQEESFKAQAAAQALRARLGDVQFIEEVSKHFPTVDFTSTLTNYRGNQEGWFKHQAGFALLFFAYAVVPPALLYALGLLVAWVRAGFRPPPAP